jgi:arylsulfatase
MRDERWARLQKLGLVAGGLSAVERNVGPPYAFADVLQKIGPGEVNRALPWTELTDVQRELQIDKMAIYAAMIDRMDRETGRVLEQIRAMGALENTIVFFLSDNGSSAEMMIRGDGHDPEAAHGSASTFLTLGPGWSTMANTPFRRHKTWTHEGGISTPLVVQWPKGIAAQGELRTTPGHLIDLVPTILELAGASAPTPPGAPPPPGRSLVPAFAKDVVIPHESLWWMHEGNRALRAGDWKIVALKTGPWELYDLSKDRAESHDLAAEKPEQLRELSEMWEKQWTQYQADARADLPVSDTPAKGAER